MSCYKCELLAEFYEQVPKTPRNYYIMTELMVSLHGSDVCDSTGIHYVTAVCPVCGETFTEVVDEMIIQEQPIQGPTRGPMETLT